jgi:type IV secretion system protein VirB10
MTGTIEPAAGVVPPQRPPAGTREAGDQVEPSIIPSVAEQARAGVPTSVTAVFVVVVSLIGLAMLFVLWRLLFHPLRVATPKVSPAVVASAAGGVKGFESTLLPPPDAGARRAKDEGRPALPAIGASTSDPIGLHNTGGSTSAASASAGPRRLPEDAPVLLTRLGSGGLADAAATAGPMGHGIAADPLTQTRASLAEYRSQLGRSLESLQAMIPGGAGQGAPHPAAAVATGAPAASAQLPTGAGGGSRGVLGMQASDTPPARADMLGSRSLVLPQGATLTCALTTRVVSAQAGFIGCQVLRNVYGVDGRVLLIERGSHLDGEYRVTQVRPGSTRIPALWTRLRTPGGVTINLDSPATGPLGESGADAYVDNRWFERVGAAMLVSVLDDSLKIVLNNETAPQQGNNAVVFQGTAQTASKMAEKVLDATVSLPPLLYANQGAQVGVYVARDIDFSSVYELQPSGE